MKQETISGGCLSNADIWCAFNLGPASPFFASILEFRLSTLALTWLPTLILVYCVQSWTIADPGTRPWHGLTQILTSHSLLLDSDLVVLAWPRTELLLFGPDTEPFTPCSQLPTTWP